MNRPASRAEELLGMTISGRYRLVSLLAVGGMAAVYLAEHVHMRKRVAIKVLRPDAQGFSDLASRFERESMVGAHILHSNVAQATDFGWLADGSAFLVLEYVPGVTLRAIIRRGPLAAGRACAILRQIAAALEACHAYGVLHRDLKPLNVMVDEEQGDRVKLIDFGLARVPVARISMLDARRSEPTMALGEPEEEEITLRHATSAGIVFGTLSYMPPEIALGMDAVDERSDLYSLGVVLYEMLAGCTPFERRQAGELLREKRDRPPPPVRLRAPEVEVPHPLEAIALRLLQPQPAARFQTARQLIDALDAAQRELGLPARALPQPSAPTLRVMPPVLKPPATETGGRRALSLVALLALLGLGVAGLEARLSVNDAAAPLASSEVAERARALGRAAGEEVERARAERTAERARLRRSLLDAQERRAWRQAGAALIDLLALDAEGLADAPLREAAVAIAVHLAFEEAPEADRLFAALGQDSGSAGLDVLYDLVSGKGGSIAAERAERLLAEPEVRARSGAALRIALEMRAARCSDKPALFARAAREGDARVLLYLERLRSARCDPRIGECCFHGSRALRRATEALDERLARSAAR